jgi:hypothetical protein
MTRVVLLLDAGQGHVAIDADNADLLARLGVTNVTIARDPRTVAIVLDGWAFDPARAGDALIVVAGNASAGRVLQPVADMAVTAARIDRRPT